MNKSILQIEKRKQLRVLYMGALVLLLPLFGSLYYIYSNSNQTQTLPIPEEKIAKVSVNLNEVNTVASSAYVVALNSDDVLYQKQPDKLLPLASITKLVTVKVAEDQADNKMVSIKKMTDPTYGDPQLTENTQWKKEDLIAYTLMESSNDGAHALSVSMQDPKFIDHMNQLASSVGLTSTRFYNETGLDNDEAGIPGSKGTAKDISTLLKFLLTNNISLYEKTKHSTAEFYPEQKEVTARNTNEVTNQIVGLLVSKTGYTDIAGGNLAVVVDMGLNDPTAFVVLHSSKEARFEDVVNLQKEYFKQVAQKLR